MDVENVGLLSLDLDFFAGLMCEERELHDLAAE